MKEIPLVEGGVALVDDSDHEMLMRYTWHAVLASRSGGVKAQASIKNKAVLMHRLIMNAPKGTQVDHRNQNTLDNQRGNLRLCTNAQNSYNRRPHKGSASGFKGVHIMRKLNKWAAEIYKDGEVFYLGLFTDPREAAQAYDNAAKHLHGEFAWLNFPQEPRNEQ